MVPEGDAVRRSADLRRRAADGRCWPPTSVPRFATVDLRGQGFLHTHTHTPWANLLTRTDAGLTLHSHRRMEGRWVTGPAVLRTGPAHQIRRHPCTATPAAIGVRLAMVEIAPTTEERQAGHPDRTFLATATSTRGCPLPENRPLVEMLQTSRG